MRRRCCFQPDGKSLAACGEGLTIWRVAEARERHRECASLVLQTHRPSTWATVVVPSHQSQRQTSGLGGSQLSGLPLGPGKRARDPVPGAAAGVRLAQPGLLSRQRPPYVSQRQRRDGRDLGHTHGAEGVHPGQGPGAVAASPDGRWLVTGATDIYTEALWSSQTGSRVFSLPQESGLDLVPGLEPGRRAPGRRLGRRRAGDLERAQDPGPTRPDRPGVACGCPAAAAAGTPAFRARDAP